MTTGLLAPQVSNSALVSPDLGIEAQDLSTGLREATAGVAINIMNAIRTVTSLPADDAILLFTLA